MNKENIQLDEIDLKQIFIVLSSAKRLIAKVVLSFVLVGLIYALTAREEYEASCQLLPESNESSKSGGFGGLGSLAGLAGINLDIGSNGQMNPELYPEIVKSTHFQWRLLNEQINYTDTVVSSYQYFKTIQSPTLLEVLFNYTIGLPGKTIGLFISDDGEVRESDFGEIYFINKRDWSILSGFEDRFSIYINSVTGIVTITTEMPDPMAATVLTNLVVDQLTEEITNYRLEKAKRNLDFVYERYGEAQKEYQLKQRQMAVFMDNNKNIVTSVGQIEYQRLQNEMNVSYEVYKSLASQLEQAKIKVKEDTPVFSILEPPRIPIDKSKPQKKLILGVFLTIGLVISITYVLAKAFLF